MKKIFAIVFAFMAMGVIGVSSASADDGHLRRYYDSNIVRVDYSCGHLRHECHEERERGYEGRACHVYEEECGHARCERLRHACHEEREGEGHFGACHRYHEVCE